MSDWTLALVVITLILVFLNAVAISHLSRQLSGIASALEKILDRLKETEALDRLRDDEILDRLKGVEIIDWLKEGPDS